MNPGVECFLLWSISMSVPKRQLVSSHVTTIAWNCLKPVFPHKENRLSFQAMARRHLLPFWLTDPKCVISKKHRCLGLMNV